MAAALKEAQEGKEQAEAGARALQQQIWMMQHEMSPSEPVSTAHPHFHAHQELYVCHQPEVTMSPFSVSIQCFCSPS